MKITDETILFDLPDPILRRCDGPIWSAMQEAGYDGITLDAGQSLGLLGHDCR